MGARQTAAFNGLDPRVLLEFDARLAAITVQSLEAAAAELLRPRTFLQVVLYPEG